MWVGGLATAALQFRRRSFWYIYIHIREGGREGGSGFDPPPSDCEDIKNGYSSG